jgi:plasmid replication initiation protein
MYNFNMNTDIEKRYVIQPNSISQSIYSASTYARRMMAMAMSLLPLEPKKESDYTVTFAAADFRKELGIERGEKTMQLIFSAIDECTGNIVKIRDHDSGDYVVYTWFQKSILHSDPNPNGQLSITMKFNPELAQAIGDFRKQYAKINLIDFGKLQSRYAIRLYELALSYQGYEGKDGNRHGEWWFEKTIEELRLLLDIGQKKYKVTGDFRRKIIDIPIEKINAAGIGIRIEPEYINKGRYLHRIIFHCRQILKGEPVPVNPATETGKEDERLIKEHPKEFEKLKAEAWNEIKQQPGLFKDHEELQEQAAEGEALKRLRELYPQVKTKGKAKK